MRLRTILGRCERKGKEIKNVSSGQKPSWADPDVPGSILVGQR